MSPSNSKTDTNRQRWTRWLLIALLSPWLALGAFALYLVANHNFHVVSPGVLYRSAQMSGPALSRAVKEYGIKSILNLRGPGIGQDWYNSEVTAARALGVQHFDYSLSASRELKDQEMDEILEVINHAPKPILIHCKSGSDRTGLVGALFLYAIEGRSASAAGHQLNALYGHLPHFIWGDTVAMDNSYWRYVQNHLEPGEAAAHLTGALPQSEATPGLSLAHSPAQP